MEGFDFSVLLGSKKIDFALRTVPLLEAGAGVLVREEWSCKAHGMGHVNGTGGGDTGVFCTLGRGGCGLLKRDEGVEV